jgi:translation initiation factor 1
MSPKSKKARSSTTNGGFVYSTNPDFSVDAEEETHSEGAQQLEAHLEKKGRGGKQVVLIKGFKGHLLELSSLGKELKQHCGVGGSVKDGDIILQGNVRDKAMEFLINAGHTVKRVGG